MTNINAILKHHAYKNRPLGFDEAYELGTFTMAPYNDDLLERFGMPRELVLVQSVAALCALHNQELYRHPDAGQQIAGICAGIFDHDIGRSRYGFLSVGRDVMDNCGMGGDLFRTPNLSSIAALVAAADGIAMLKHGSPGNTDNVGSSDFLQRCGVNLFAHPDLVRDGVDRLGFGYTDALDEGYKRIHTQTHTFARLAHMNDIIGPITNPVDPARMRRRIIGINHLIPPERVAEAYVLMNRSRHTSVERGMFVRGFAASERNGGIDEVSLMPGGTRVAELDRGHVRTYDIYAHDFGLQEMTPDELDPGQDKAETSRRILAGDVEGPLLHAALANAALIFALERGTPLPEGVARARDLISSGSPYRVLQEYARLSEGTR